jgi:hypothetical protein
MFLTALKMLTFCLSIAVALIALIYYTNVMLILFCIFRRGKIKVITTTTIIINYKTPTYSKQVNTFDSIRQKKLNNAPQLLQTIA